jgi:hypothetical protein
MKAAAADRIVRDVRSGLRISPDQINGRNFMPDAPAPALFSNHAETGFHSFSVRPNRFRPVQFLGTSVGR